ncbi:topless-related protein 1-like [Gastrolobium bilobum]|uniref:topless-related protein 1-like n=1 Tax=Gastrolobium bilobum TaxID=150636 RepID=UPI002AAF7226|nr:topless-related protein 1-like [Gastrolobium bilobum]
MSNVTKELVFLALQYFDEKGLSETAHTLQRESGLYFDMKHFEDLVLEGKWDDAESYLSAFTRIKDNNHSIKIYFEMRKQKFLEALDSNDRYKALDILLKDLQVFAPMDEGLFKNMTQLLTIKNIRERKSLSTYQDANSARKKMMDEIKEVIKKHPLLDGKLKLPAIKSHRLSHLLNESLNWQHQNPTSEPDLFGDHVRYSNPFNITAPTNSETNLEFSMDSDESGCKKVLEDQPNSIVESHNKMKNLFEICRPSQCRVLRLPMHSEINNKIVRLTYTHAGNAILALTSNGIHPVWAWRLSSFNLDAKATTQVCPELWQPCNGLKFMSNNVISGNNHGDLVSSFALTKTDSYLMSTSGGMISLFNINTFKTIETIMPPPPMVTCLALYPQDNNVLAVGMDNSSILIYHVVNHEVQIKLEGHSKRVTALAFSNTLNVLVSGDVNSQIVVWNTNGWEKLKERYLQIHEQKVPEVLSETQIQFHPDQIKFLAVHNSHLAIYEATELTCVNQWIPEVSVAISQATFSSDGQIVYATFVDGTLAIFDALKFQMHCRVHPYTFLSPYSSLSVYPISIAAHPQKPSQFAVGLTDGSVYVLEPREPDGNCISFSNDKQPEKPSVKRIKLRCIEVKKDI